MKTKNKTRTRTVNYPKLNAQDYSTGYYMTSNEHGAIALVNKLSGVEMRVWTYLMMVDPYADFSKGEDKEKVYKRIPSPDEIALVVAADRDTVVRAMRKLRKLGLYDYKITEWRGHNLTAYKARLESDRLKANKKQAQTPTQQREGEINRHSKKSKKQAETVAQQGKEEINRHSKKNKKQAEPVAQQGKGEINREDDYLIAETISLSSSRLNNRVQSPKPVPGADRDRSQTIQTNPDFSYSKSEQEKLEDPWLDDEETNTKVDEFKQELERQQAITSQEIERQQAFLDKLEENNSTVEAEIIDQQTETVSTSDKETPTAIVANPNLSQEEVYSACSTFEAKFKHRAANPKQTNMDRLQEALNWIPDGVWCTEPGKLDPEFVKWSVTWWMGKFDCKDEYDAKANVLAYYKNDLTKLVIRWEQYSNTYLAKYKNADLRLSHGCKVDEKEEKELKNNVRAVTKPLPPEMSYEDKQLQQTNNSVTQLDPTPETKKIAPAFLGAINDKINEKHNLVKKDRDENSVRGSKTVANTIVSSVENKIYNDIPEHADNVGAYRNFDRAEYDRKRKQESEQLATSEQWAEFTAKFKTFNKKSSLRPIVSDKEDLHQKIEKQLKTLNSFLQSGDAILIAEALKAAEREDFVVIRDSLGRPIKIEDMEF